MAEEFPQESGRTATQRGSLKQVNATLMAQTEVLRDTQASIFSTNNLLTKSLEGQLKAASMTRLKDIEKDREGGKFKAVAGGIGTAGSKVAGAAQSGIGSLQGMLGKIGSFLTPAALMALPGILGGVLLKRGIPALAVGLFSDEIADFLLGPEANKEMRDQVSKAIQFGAAGSLLGKRFALIGAAAGFLIDDEVAKQLTEVGKSFGNMLGMDIKNLDDLKAVMTSIGVFLRDNLGKGLEGINQLLNGDIKAFLGIGEEGGGNLLSTIGTLGALGLVFAPSATFSVAGGLFKGSLKTIIGAISLLWKGVPAALGALGLLGQTIGSAATGATAKGVAGKAAGGLSVVGRGLGAMLMGPAGAIIGIGVLTAAGISAFAETEMGKAMIKKFDEEGGHGGDIAGEAAYFEDPSTTVEKPFIQTEQDNALRQTYVRAMERSEPGSDYYELNKKALERLDRKMVDPGLAKAAGLSAPPPSHAQQLKTDAMNNGSSNQPMIVDGSNNTTNNIGQSNTTLSAPPPSAGQNDDYSGAVNSRMNLSTSGYL
jgi:hypothetical protein